MLIDISIPVKAGDVFRPGTPAVEIATRTFRHRSEGEYKTTILSLPAHSATHVDLVFRNRKVAPERMIGSGKLFDVTGITKRQIQPEDIPRRADVQTGDFVFFRTDWSKFAGTDRYSHHPELSREVVQWLVSRKVNAVGIDAQGLGRNRHHGQYDRLLAENDIFVIENLANLAAIPVKAFTVYFFPLSIEEIDAIPARVLVGVEENPRNF
ncbi:MAG: cyclase family protein [Fidelibacterota bacterium]